MRPYIVRRSDHLTKLALRFGFSADEVWSHPRNAELKAKRRNPNILCPGDVLWIPDEARLPLPLDVGAANAYVASVPEVTVRLTLRDAAGVPLRGRKYVAVGPGTRVEGEVGTEGLVEIPMDAHVEEILLAVEGEDAQWRLLVGQLDPHDEASGAEQRLLSLSGGGALALDRYWRPARADEAAAPAPLECPERRLALSVLAFQRARGLDATGDVDDGTRAKLRSEFGC
jgi:hypothetical protein